MPPTVFGEYVCTWQLREHRRLGLAEECSWEDLLYWPGCHWPWHGCLWVLQVWKIPPWLQISWRYREITPDQLVDLHMTFILDYQVMSRMTGKHGRCSKLVPGIQVVGASNEEVLQLTVAQSEAYWLCKCASFPGSVAWSVDLSGWPRRNWTRGLVCWQVLQNPLAK